MRRVQKVTDQMIAKMRGLRIAGITCADIAKQLGLSKSTVSRYTNDDPVQRRHMNRKDVLHMVKNMTYAQMREPCRYRVKIYNIRRREDAVVTETLDRRPVYSDMMQICKKHKIPAFDFADDPGTDMMAQVYYGTVYSAHTKDLPLARFKITRLAGDVYPEDFFR